MRSAIFVLVLVLVTAPLAARAWPADAASVDRAERQLVAAMKAAKKDLLPNAASEAARVPWPLLEPSSELDIARMRASLDPKARRAWALDRALPMLSGELVVGPDVLADVLAEVRAASGAADDEARRELARLTEARRAYASRDLARAVEQYAQVTRESGLWTDALREQAWTLLLLGRPQDALGATVSLRAPYFAVEEHAEARLLKATVLLERCRFAEARALVAALADATLPAADERAIAHALSAARAPGGIVWERAWGSPLVERARAALALAPEGARRERLSALATRLLRDAFAAETESVRELKERALRLRYEAVRGERLVLESNRRLERPRPDAPLLEDDEVAWTFDGTYWRDEIGTYRYSAGDACPKGAGR